MMDFERAAVPYWPIRRRRLVRRNVSIAAMACLVIGSAVFVRHRIASQPIAERVFDQVVTTVDFRYYDRTFHGLDWNGIVDHYRPLVERAPNVLVRYRLLQQMLGRLHDSHTAVFSPEEVNGVEAKDEGMLGAVFVTLGGERVVLRVTPRSPAAAAGLRPGYIVAETPCTAPRPSAWKAYVLGVRDPLSGRSWRTTLRAPTGGSFDANVPPDLDWGVIDGRIGYLKMASFPNNIEEELGWAITDIASKPAMILDLRGNPGGLIDAVEATAGVFLPPGTFVVSGTGRYGLWRRRFFATGAAHVRYDGRLAVLVDGASESGAEALASALALHHRAVIIGEHTARHVLGVQVEERLADGGLLRVATLDIRDAVGNILEGRGVTPDVIIGRTPADVARGRDPQLRAAIEYLSR